MSDKVCGNCRQASKPEFYLGAWRVYCIAYGTDTNTIDCKGCFRWREGNDLRQMCAVPTAGDKDENMNKEE